MMYMEAFIIDMIERYWRVGLTGIIVGCISAFSFGSSFRVLEETTAIQQLLSFVPGLVFGIAVATIYFLYSEKSLVMKILGAVAISVQGLITYQIAYYITFSFVTLVVRSSSGALNNSDPTLGVAPFAAAIGGYVATLAFVFLLQVLTKKYSASLFKLSLYGGLLGGLLIDAIFLFPNNPQYHFSSVTFGSLIFFCGWQTIMLFIISRPLTNKTVVQPTVPILTPISYQPSAPSVTAISPNTSLPKILPFLVGVIALIPIGFYYYDEYFPGSLDQYPVPQSTGSHLPAFIDKGTYKVLTEINGGSRAYAKDKNNAYLVDISATEDPDAMYGAYAIAKIEGADVATFALVEDEKGQSYNAEYARDKNHVYYGTISISNADPASFVSFYTDYTNGGFSSLAKDAHHVYFGGALVTEADPGSFRILGETDDHGAYAVDKTHVFITVTVEVPDTYTYTSQIKMIPHADPVTFVWLDGNYTKDKNQVYYDVRDHTRVVAGADPGSFSVITGNHRCAAEETIDPREVDMYADAKDKNHCYIRGYSARFSPCEQLGGPESPNCNIK